MAKIRFDHNNRVIEFTFTKEDINKSCKELKLKKLDDWEMYILDYPDFEYCLVGDTSLKGERTLENLRVTAYSSEELDEGSGEPDLIIDDDIEIVEDL